MKYHDLVYLVTLCVHAYVRVASYLISKLRATCYQWYFPFLWALFMTGNNWLGLVKRLKKLIGIWIGPLGQYTGYTKEAGQARQQLCQVGRWPAEGSSSILMEGILKKTDCQVIWQWLDTDNFGRAECWMQIQVIREPPVLEEKPGSVQSGGESTRLAILTTYCSAIKSNEWHQGSTYRCDMIWPHLYIRAMLSTIEIRNPENYSLLLQLGLRKGNLQTWSSDWQCLGSWGL